MMNHDEICEMRADGTATAAADAYALGVYRPGAFREEAKAFFRQCVGDETYRSAMASDAGRAHHYVPARAFLNQTDWEKFCWIELYGSLSGYPE